MTFSKGTKKRPTYQRSSGTANTEGPFEVATKFFLGLHNDGEGN